MSINYEQARKLFDYRDDGCLIWRITKSKNVPAGRVAGTQYKNWYSQVRVDGILYMTHRIIWLWHHGYMPEGELDHINKMKHDNRIENLREVSHQCNLRNTGNHKDNKSGVKGVYKSEGWSQWLAFIVLKNKQRKLGMHDSFDEAVLARLAAEQCLDWEGCDSSSPAYRYAIRNGLIHRRR